MSLRELAEADLGLILEDKTTGFGWDITVTDPDGTTADLVGMSGDISQLIDPETGMIVSGRSASVTLRISSLALAGLGIPQNVKANDSKPWRITFNDINGNPWDFKVVAGNPDRTLGQVTCMLELWR